MVKFYQRLSNDLSLYVRQLAWLNTAPEKKSKPRRDTIAVEMPKCDALYMVEYLFRLGPCMETSMGRVPLTHTEIESWQRNIGIELTSWEAETMRYLSIAYLSESQRALKFDCPAPWMGDKLARKFIATDMKSAIRGMAGL